MMQGPSSYNNVIANSVIIVGPSGELLMYSTATPQLNKLLASIVPTNIPDTAGNNVLGGGLFSYSSTGPGDFYAGGLEGNAFVIEHAAAQNGSYITRAQVVYSTVFGTPGLLIQDILGSNGLLFSDTAQQIIVIGNMVAQSPTSAQVAETWHTISLDAGWSQTANAQTPQYRLLSDGNIQLKGGLTHASFTGTTDINAGNPLPAPYAPSSNIYLRSNDNNRAGIFVRTSGVISAFPIATGNTLVELAGTYYPGT